MSQDDPPDQMGLFSGPPGNPGRPKISAATPRLERARLGTGAPPLWLGTSSWSFPGWADLVYAGVHKSGDLSRHGLAAYSAHPLLNAVSVDRSYYGPVSSQDFADYAQQVPPDFRFTVKAWRGLTLPRIDGAANPGFLDPDVASRAVVEPSAQGLGDTLGSILFQFSPLPLSTSTQRETFCRELKAFLRALPSGVTYDVEVRNPGLLGPQLREALDASDTGYTLNLLPVMPDLDTQFRRMQLASQDRYLVRWLLAPGWDYRGAKAAFAPFNRLHTPQLALRQRLAQWIRWSGEQGKALTLLANNKAEGCAPLSLLHLARELS